MNNKVLYGVIALLATTTLMFGLLYWQESQDDSADQADQTAQTPNNSAQEEVQKFQQHSAADVVTAIQSAGLSIQYPTEQEIGGDAAPATEVESMEFVIEQVAPNGGQILVFDEQGALESKKAHFDNFPDLAPYVYVKDNVVLQLNSGLPVAEARKYQEALNSL